MVVMSSIFFYFYMMANNFEARLDVLAQVEKQLIEIVQDCKHPLISTTQN